MKDAACRKRIPVLELGLKSDDVSYAKACGFQLNFGYENMA
ncbi:hypothetical protein [Xenorhabdus sp. PB62.4]|nr:hypothetical protein [Xenorhabdus sp. PB62.4]